VEIFWTVFIGAMAAVGIGYYVVTKGWARFVAKKLDGSTKNWISDLE
jgi:hypothetical protein